MSEQPQLDVVGVGAANTDLFVYLNKMPAVGATVHGDRFEQGCGGKNHNQVLQAAMLGAKVGVVSAVGCDSNGDAFVKNFEAHNVDTSAIERHESTHTGVASILVDGEGNNCIVIVPGANDKLSAASVRAHADVIASAKVLVTQNEIPHEATEAALEIGAASLHTLVLFNPAPADTNLPTRLLELADIVLPNETEAEALTGVKVTDVASAETAARELIKRGCKTVVVTLGGKGSLIVRADAESAVHVPAVPVERVVDTTGAGDSFIGALAHCLARGDALETAVARANVCASYSVQAAGTQKSFADAAKLDADERWNKKN